MALFADDAVQVEDRIEDVDKADEGNSLLVANYVFEIYEYLYSLEVTLCPPLILCLLFCALFSLFSLPADKVSHQRRLSERSTNYTSHASGIG